MKNKIAGNDTFFSNINQLKTENENLKQKNSDLEKQVRELEIVKAENATLKEYVNLKDKYSEYTTIPTHVIQRDLGNFSKVIVIIKSTKHVVHTTKFYLFLMVRIYGKGL